MKEIGGYIELDTYSGAAYHHEAVALNCGRNALAYLIQAKKIRMIYVPYFICASVTEVCKRCGVQVACYSIDSAFRPILPTQSCADAWLYIVNYYGQLTDAEILAYKRQWGNVILDNAQAFFKMPVQGVDTLYTCRKFFGVADGAYLYTDQAIGYELEQDESFQRMTYILGRYERNASEFYAQSVENNRYFVSQPIKRMSKLTTNLLNGVDYEQIKKRRTENFAYLHAQLGKLNKLRLTIPEGAFMYPFYCEDGMQIRKLLQQKKIYIPTLWSDVLKSVQSDCVEYDYAANILPLPVDQRYHVEDMERLVEQIRNAQIM